jgi:hypothetical protein
MPVYEIRVKGHLDSRWSEWFDGLEITNLENEEAMLSGDITDQAALHGLLTRVRDLGLPLVGVRRLDPFGEQDPARTPTSGTGRGSGQPLL